MNFGTVLAIVTGVHTPLSIKKPKVLTLSLFFYVNYLRISAGRMNPITFLIFGKCIFKPSMTKEEISLNFVIIICKLFHL